MVDSTNSLQKAIYDLAEGYAIYLESKLGDKIAKIVLFGSASKRIAHINSDIDVLILHFGGQELEDRIANETFNYMVKSGAPIEYVTYGYYEAKYNPSYFVQSVLDKGEVLYMKSGDELKRKEIEGLIGLSESYENDAKECFEIYSHTN